MTHADLHALAYRPFLDPLALHDEWYLLMLPLVFMLSMGYKAVRVPNENGRFSMGLYLRRGLIMVAQVAITITVLYAAAIAVVGHLLDRIV